MSLRATCEACGKVYNVSERLAGKTVSCKECGQSVEIPDIVDEADDVEEYEEDPPSHRAAPPRLGKPRAPRPAVGGTRSTGSSSSNLWVKIALIIGAGGLVAVLCCGGLFWKVSSKLADTTVYPNQPEFGAPTEPFPLASFPVPQFPKLGTPFPLQPSGVLVYQIDLRSIPANMAANAPGTQMTMRVYLPPGEQPAKSIPCVLVAPAGTNLLVGNQIDGLEYHDETLPYAEAGMAVIMYSIDGPADIDKGDSEFRQGYLKFRASGAGVVNGRNALEFALARLPQVDPSKIYTAGHSSAGTLSLLFAEHEPRVAKCAAYAPAPDVELRLGDAIDSAAVRMVLPKVKEFARQSSPTTHVARFQCPVFLFHALDDSNVPYADSQRFAERLRSAGKQVSLENIATGDHYEPMITDGIPRAIAWFKK